MSAAFVTVGDTPLCDSCHMYYSERHCEDCDQNQCSWCNIDIHTNAIGKRNHYRPRFYGDDPTAEESTAGGGEGGEGKDGRTGRRVNAAEEESAALAPLWQVDESSGRVNITTEHIFNLTAEEAFDLLGDWQIDWLPYPSHYVGGGSLTGDTRTLSLPIAADGRAVEVRDTLMQRSERDMYYTYSRAVPAAAGLAFTDALSRFSFVSLGRKQSALQWTTSVLPAHGKIAKQAGEAVARMQLSWQPFFEQATRLDLSEDEDE